MVETDKFKAEINCKKLELMKDKDALAELV